MQLQLTRFMSNPHNLSLVHPDAEPYLLSDVGRVLSGSSKVIMLTGESTNLFLVECMMRGVNADIVLKEPGEKVYGGLLCYLIHSPHEYPDYDDDGYVWIGRPL